MPEVHVVSSAGQLKAWFSGVITSFFPKVNVDAAGALAGDGNSALAVKVDGATITINGSNQLVSSGGGITQLTGDVTAGPGSGSQAATIGANKVTNAMLAGSIDLATKVTGTLADGNLSSNVPLKNGTNAFTGANSFATNPLDLLVGQIKFPATQNPSSGANTLDDYEEGTWTPIIGGSGGESGQAYANQVGNYVKIGQLVTAFCIVSLSTKGTITGFVQVKGLPFASKNLTNNDQPVTMSYFVNMTNTFTSLAGILQENATGAFIAGVPSAATGVTLLVSGDLSNTTQFLFSVSYRSDS